MNQHLENICKIGQGAACCKYLTAGPTGFNCEKLNPVGKAMIDRKWAAEPHVAQGDNCEGITNYTLLNQSSSSNEATG